ARNAGDLKLARDLLTTLADVAPKGTAFRLLGLYHLAQIAVELKDVDTAIARYESLLEEISDPQPYFQRYAELFMIYRGQLQVRETLGRLYLLRGDNEKAVEIFSDILSDRPDNADVLGLLCHAYVQQKNFTLAREAARKMMEARPDRSEGYQRLAEVYRAEGKPEGVLADLETFYKTQPGNRMLAFQLAGLYESFGRKDEAAKLYGAISVGADSSQGPSVAAALKLVELQLQANRPVEAIEALAVAISGAPADSAILVRGAQLVEGLKNPAAVYQDALRLVTDDQKNYGAFILVGMLAETVKRRDEAIVLYDKALQRQPKAAIAYSRKADLLIEAQHPAEALAVYEAALKAGLDVPVFHRKMGMILEYLDRPGEAMVQYRIARQAAPDDKPTRNQLAGLQARTGDLPEAEKDLQGRLAKFPKEVGGTPLPAEEVRRGRETRARNPEGAPRGGRRAAAAGHDHVLPEEVPRGRRRTQGPPGRQSREHRMAIRSGRHLFRDGRCGRRRAGTPAHSPEEARSRPVQERPRLHVGRPRRTHGEGRATGPRGPEGEPRERRLSRQPRLGAV
ncbi:MAG: tetratricopeptide repeat protein, partial [Planctomycetota bacterium]|nr:tetratricopeptide repeat protein [Planctomycetota bacterium]